VGQPSTRQLKAGLECGWPGETQTTTIKKSGYMREHSTKITQMIWISDIIFGSGKIQPDVVQSPGSQAKRNTVSPIMPVQVEPVEALLLTVHMAVYLMVVIGCGAARYCNIYNLREAAPPCPIAVRLWAQERSGGPRLLVAHVTRTRRTVVGRQAVSAR
jgi:hypothetical protein